jgi:uncharacterized membrane protein
MRNAWGLLAAACVAAAACGVSGLPEQEEQSEFFTQRDTREDASVPPRPAAPPGGSQAEWDSDRARAIWAEAAARGVTFRAIGQEPAWQLELFEPERIVFITDGGATRVERAWSLPEFDRAGGRVLLRPRFDGPVLRVELRQEACFDSMSGEPFDFAVVVTLDGLEHHGCGRALG